MADAETPAAEGAGPAAEEREESAEAAPPPEEEEKHEGQMQDAQEGAQAHAEAGDGADAPKQEPSASQVAIEVTALDIRVFRTSQAARRFPALRMMSDVDVAALIVADRASKMARGVKVKQPERPVVEVPYRPSLRPAVQDEGFVREKRPTFAPCNHFDGRREVERKGVDSFAICTAPFDEAKTEYVNSIFSDQRKRVSLGFTYNNPSEAKTSIAVNYYLNSPDAETLAMEKAETLRRSVANKDAFIKSLRGPQA